MVFDVWVYYFWCLVLFCELAVAQAACPLQEREYLSGSSCN